jgi:hypothetical protein
MEALDFRRQQAHRADPRPQCHQGRHRDGSPLAQAQAPTTPDACCGRPVCRGRIVISGNQQDCHGTTARSISRPASCDDYARLIAKVFTLAQNHPQLTLGYYT